MPSSYEFSDVDGFACGTVGPKGQRVFFLQVREGDTEASLKMEKQQVAALARFLGEMLGDIERKRGAEPPEPLDADTEEADFREPDGPDWIVGTIGAAYEETNRRIILWIEELTEGDEDEAASARIALRPGQVAGFIQQANALVAAGRPPCPYCGAPLNHDDGFCPCWN
ncbi:MAG: DUF3090 family protein [bacterium]|nr:DUF3090 family protein [bacterium]